MPRFLKGMAFVPFLLVTWSSAAFIISYVVAVLSGHVNPFLPYISDTGTTPPESGIFGFMINFSAFLGAATMYTRYKIVEKQNQTSYFSTPVFNLVSLVLGLAGCIGMGIVANFQAFSQLLSMSLGYASGRQTATRKPHVALWPIECGSSTKYHGLGESYFEEVALEEV
uniref:DNA damage regulated autophagy modulator 1 n=1 Tax=Pipistrellus kuhlii TaxID=59472 RepID=A0A7J7ZGT0_PIPKU|nr:DNA damage regulated autophagy modulator 1 [Pipistrellus kuhlii]